jgi:membrane-bound serine protease (ClpP class)
MRNILIRFIFVTITILQISFISAKEIVYKIDIKKDIGSTTWLYVQKGFDEAINLNATSILIHMNTYGGEVLYADSIRTKILNSDIPVYVFIDNNAASAGALISIAADKIFMRPGANIGAATVVNQTGEQMPDKYQSYMRATMRSTAESHGKDTIINGKDTTFRWKRDPLIAEAMVDERTVVPGLIDSGRTLTFTALEAIKYNYCEGLANNVDEVITKHLGFTDFELLEFKPTTYDNIKGFLMSSVFQGILIMLIIGGIYFELQTPGIGFPLGVAILAAILYFAPLYMDGLAANWEILVFIIGLVLVALEIFVIPGFGIAGVSGILFIITGLTLSLLDNINFDFEPVNAGAFRGALLTVILGLTGGFGLVIYLTHKIGTKGIFSKMALKTTMQNDEGYIGVPITGRQYVGFEGIATTVLRPSGKVRIEDEIFDAVSEDGFIDKNEKVIVLKYESGQVYVRRV